MTPFIIFLILTLIGFWIVIPFVKVTDNDINLYAKCSKWIKVENVELVERYKQFGVVSNRKFLYKDMVHNRFYLLNFYTTSKSEYPIFNIQKGSFFLYINTDEKEKGTYDYPIIALNYAISDNLSDQLTEKKYIYNVKNYLRYDKGSKYTSAEKSKQKIKTGGIVAMLIVIFAIFGVGYYIIENKK